MKKIMSLFLSAVMIITLFSVSAVTANAASYKLGDADRDGNITVLDATAIQKVLASILIDQGNYIARLGDVTGDGLDITDSAIIQKFLAHFKVNYPIGTKTALSGGNEGDVSGAPAGLRVDVVDAGRREYKKVSSWRIFTAASQAQSGIRYVVGPATTEVDSRDFGHSTKLGDAYVESTIEYLANGKLRVHWTPGTDEDIRRVVLCDWDTGKPFLAINEITSEMLNQKYCDFDLPLVSETAPKLRLSWGEVSSSNGYQISFDGVTWVDITGTSYEFEPAYDTNYTFYVKSANSDEVSELSFSTESVFAVDTPAEEVTIPITQRGNVSVCNRCGQDVSGHVYDHILPAEALNAPTYTVDYTTSGGYVKAWSGSSTVSLTAHLWDYNSETSRTYTGLWFSTEGLSDMLVVEDTTTCEEILEACRENDPYGYGKAPLEDILNQTMPWYHRRVQGCTDAYHSETRTFITGLTTKEIPATGHTELAVR